ncbi:ARMT1-like domain-containing protein [Vulcanisaeta souniana]|uniref:Carboxylate--amine ligase n=2 Tax=Vulcanisaeta souniana JCM 11219 TaxID=1293586 RepID=A0ABM8BPX0_9CREN|nr:ARMT1-like domain-containing protein [Vulcanisaeta souniana]BDR92912.1 carboxylate--amine ligase [Vulcanisaeta souniana JCM 11219]
MLYIETPECILCALESRTKEIKKFGIDDINTYMHITMHISSLIPRGRTPLFIESFDLITKILNNEDPHADEKKNLEDTASLILGKVVSDAGNDIARYFEIAAAANSVDVPMRDYQFDINDFVNKLLEEAAWLNITKEGLAKMLNDIHDVGYVVDNSGEFQIDALLIRKLVDMGLRVTVYARGLPYEVDVTADYVSKVLSDKVKIVSTGNRYPPFYNRGLWQDLRRHDLVISKGVGNFESYLENDLGLRVIFLFRAKCGPMIKLLKVPKNSPVVYLRGNK